MGKSVFTTFVTLMVEGDILLYFHLSDDRISFQDRGEDHLPDWAGKRQVAASGGRLKPENDPSSLWQATPER